MKQPAATSLTADGICAIIDACSKNGVAALTYGDLHVSFFGEASRLGRNQLASVDQSFGGETPADGEVEKPMLLTPEDRELREDMRLAQLMTDNPVAYEQEMIDANLSELNDAGEDS